MPKLQLSPAAKEDLTEIAVYTEDKWGVAQKRKYMAALNACLKDMARRPRGRLREELAAGLRAFHAGRHMIFYRLVEDKLIVVRVLHVSMDFERHFDEPRTSASPITARPKSLMNVLGRCRFGSPPRCWSHSWRVSAWGRS